METEILFEEIQFFAAKGVQQMVKLFTGLLLFSSLFSLFIHSQQQKEITGSLLFLGLFSGLASFVLSKTKLITQVRTDGIYVTFPPLQTRSTICRWDNIEKLFIRTYNPLAEYGGWGIRYSPNGRAYNTSGNIGLQILFKDGSKLLIGTQQPEALRKALHQVAKFDYFH